MSYLKDREIWLSKVPTGNPPAGFFWKFIQNGKVVVRDSSGNEQMMIATNGNQAITGSLIVTGGITGTISSASYVQYSNVANKPTLVSGSGQISFNGITNKPTLVSGSGQVTFLGLSSIPSGIVSGSAQVAQFGYATTGANGFNGSQSITGSLTVTGQVIAQTLNVQQVTSSIVYSSGSNVFGNNSGNTHRFTGSVNITGSLSVNGALSGASATFSGNVTSDDLILTAGTLFGTGNTGFSNRSSDTTLYLQMPATGFNITDNALNTRFILSSAGAITSQTTGNNGIIKIGGSTYYSQLETNSTLGGLKIKSVWGAANSGIIQFINGTSENIRMHIADNGNVDVGLTNATDRLTISRNVADNAGGITLYNAETSGYGSALTFRVNYAGVYNVSRIHGDWGTGNSGLLHFFTANTSQTLVERMLIDGSGNVGIGTVSPVANDGTSRTLQLGNRLVIQNVIGTQFLLGTNCYYDGVSWKYIEAVKAQAVRGTGESGAIQFSLSPTGTVGGTITNMDGSDIKMIILDTGNVGIGTTSPETNLTIEGTNRAFPLIYTTGYGNLHIQTNETTATQNFGGSLTFGGLGRTSGPTQKFVFAAIAGRKETTTSGDTKAYLQFGTADDITNEVKERMRITSGGNVGIGKTPTKRLDVEASVAGEVAQITNARNSASGDYALVTLLGANATNTNNYHYIAGTSGGADRLYIYGNGNVVNINGSYGTLSDISLKENIVDATPKLADLLQLKVRNFNLIGSEEKQIGFVAQEFEEIFPKMVDIDGKNGMKTIKTSVLVPMLVKAIQEQQTLIESLKSRIEILEQ